MVIHGICMLFRSVVMVATSYPDPSRFCAEYHSPSSTFSFWKQTITHNGLLTCGDLMYSGHTLIYIITAMTWNKYFTIPEKIIAWIVCLASAISLIATRMHYTDDVIIAFYVSVTTFYIYHLWALNPIYRKSIKFIDWLERDLDRENDKGAIFFKLNS